MFCFLTWIALRGFLFPAFQSKAHFISQIRLRMASRDLLKVVKSKAPALPLTHCKELTIGQV